MRHHISTEWDDAWSVLEASLDWQVNLLDTHTQKLRGRETQTESECSTWDEPRPNREHSNACLILMDDSHKGIFKAFIISLHPNPPSHFSETSPMCNYSWAGQRDCRSVELSSSHLWLHSSNQGLLSTFYQDEHLTQSEWQPPSLLLAPRFLRVYFKGASKQMQMSSCIRQFQVVSAKWTPPNFCHHLSFKYSSLQRESRALTRHNI